MNFPPSYVAHVALGVLAILNGHSTHPNSLISFERVTSESLQQRKGDRIATTNSGSGKTARRVKDFTCKFAKVHRKIATRILNAAPHINRKRPHVLFRYNLTRTRARRRRDMPNAFMQEAIERAVENVRSGRGGPFAAIVVKQGGVIAAGA